MLHAVEFAIPRRDLGKADVEFTVKCNGKKLGELQVSKGSVVWFPQYKGLGYKVSWTEFNDVMKKYGKRSEKR
jgi:hypothetical protein